MARIRSITVVSLLVFWTLSPALACLPDLHMTPAEMGCCKKMVGDCQMGDAQHPCCTTTPKANSSIASVQPVIELHPVLAFVSPSTSFDPQTVAEGEAAQASLGLPPPAPGPISILRI
ncbi:MAG TPA: hypothetical protein VGN86_10515 [Pyrinomonadaceae bacterium]|nr:hypothetical protein [Pyrinomonadaceae bacterium]